MDADLPTPLSPQRTYSTDKELDDRKTEKECVKCIPTHVCRQCNTRWSGLEPPKPPKPPVVTVVQRLLTFKQRCMRSYRRHLWLYRSLLLLFGAIIFMVVVVAVIFRPKPPTGVSKNGTGIVALDRGDESQKVDIFYQHVSGQIRHIVLDDPTQQWNGYVAFDNGEIGFN
jgi:hypothetical protein